MKNIFQTEYPQETIDELLAWIDSNPQGEIELGHGIHINDISLFATFLGYIARYAPSKTDKNPIKSIQKSIRHNF